MKEDLSLYASLFKNVLEKLWVKLSHQAKIGDQLPIDVKLLEI